jgi:hypothetical protein
MESDHKMENRDVIKDAKPDGKYRGYCITTNNYAVKDIQDLKDLKYQYLIIGEEVAKTGTPHLQSYVYFKNERSWKAVQRILGHSWIGVARGTAAQNQTYCSKEKLMFEDGQMPEQGARKDLEELKDAIMAGEMTVDDICIDNPMMFHKYGRTLERIQTIALRRRHRSHMTKGVWYWGKTGVGKSHKVFEDYSWEKCYVKQLEDEWWDGYTGQEIVILNEFRGQLTIGQLLKLTDRWVENVKQRCKEPVPFLAKEVRVTSCFHPAELYSDAICKGDSYAQIERRFEIIELTERLPENGAEVVRG